MKKLFYLFIACCISTMALAQKITEKDLQGTWKAAALNANGVYIDIATEIVTFPEELKSQLTPEMIEQFNSGLKEGIKNIKNSLLIFSGNNFTQGTEGNEKKGTYSLTEADGKQLITFSYPDGTIKDPVVLYIKDKQLHLVKSEKGEIIFNKAK